MVCLFIEYRNSILVLYHAVDIPVYKIPALTAPAMTAYIHGIYRVFGLAVSVFDFLRIFFHEHTVEFFNVTDNIQPIIFNARILQVCNNILLCQKPVEIIGKSDVFGGAVGIGEMCIRDR